MNDIALKVSECFSDSPGPRWRDLGDNSGQEFRERFIEEHFVEKETYKIIVNFDDLEGCAPSFLDEVFGGIARMLTHDFEWKDEDYSRLSDVALSIYKNSKGRSKQEVLDRVVIIANEDPMLEEEYLEYLEDAC